MWWIVVAVADPPKELAEPPPWFEAWIESVPSRTPGKTWFRLDMLEEDFAGALDAAPIDVPNLPHSASEGRSGGLVELSARASSLAAARTWGVRVEVAGEHYTNCSDSPPPPLDGPVFGVDEVRFVSRERAPKGCAGDPDLVLRPKGELVSVTQCGTSFLARPRDSLRLRYTQAEDAWVAAEIARFGLPVGSKPTHIRQRGVDLRCFPAATMDGTNRGPLLGCERLEPPFGSDLWFDEKGAVGKCLLHNVCGWRGILINP